MVPHYTSKALPDSIEIPGILSAREVKRIETTLFSCHPISKQELWLLSFAAPAVCLSPLSVTATKICVDRIALSEQTQMEQLRQHLNLTYKIQRSDDIRHMSEECIRYPSSLFLDRLLPVLKNEKTNMWPEMVYKLLPVTHKQAMKIKKLEPIIDEFIKFGFLLPEQSTMAFDLARAARLTAIGYFAGLVDKQFLISFLEQIALQACSTYPSWKDYISGFLLGRTLWYWGKESYFDMASNLVCSVARILAYSSHSALSRHPIHAFQDSLTYNKPYPTIALSHVIQKTEFQSYLQIPFVPQMIQTESKNKILETAEIKKSPDNFLKERQNKLFTTTRLSKQEQWLLAFAAPAAGHSYIFPSSLQNYPVTRYTQRDTNEQKKFYFEINDWLGIETENELFYKLDQLINHGAAAALDLLFSIALKSKQKPMETTTEHYSCLNEEQILSLPVLQNTMQALITQLPKFPDKTVFAFDLARAARLCILSCVAGITNKNRMFAFLERIAATVCHYYQDWQSYTSAFTVGNILWMFGKEIDYQKEIPELLLLTELLVDAGISPYTQISMKDFSPEEPPFKGYYPSFEITRSDFMQSLYCPLKTTAPGDRLFPIQYKKLENSIFSTVPAPLFECWLIGFAAPGCHLTGLKADRIERYHGLKKFGLIRRLDKWFGTVSREELIHYIESTFQGGHSRECLALWKKLRLKKDYFDSDPECLSEPDSLSEKSQSEKDTSVKMIKNLIEFTAFTAFLNRYSIKVPTEKESLRAFDLVHIAIASLTGYSTGYLKLEEAQIYLKRTAIEANEHYSSWNSYLGSYLLCRALWLLSTGNQKLIDNNLQNVRLVRILQSSSRSIYRQNKISDFLDQCMIPCVLDPDLSK